MPNINQSQRDALALTIMGEHVAKASATVPQTTTQHLFVITGGRVIVTLLFGEVTTIIQSTDPVLKVTATPTVGNPVDIASTVDTSSLEAGGRLVVEGDGTALVKGNAGAALFAVQVPLVLVTGYIDLISGANKTGATKWDLFYIPVDDGALIVSA